jgi:hypothetical protein
VSGPEELRDSERELRLLRVESSTHAHLGTTGLAPAARPFGPGKFGDSDRGPRAGGCGPEELRDSSCDSERTGADLYISAPPGRRRRPRRHRWHRTRKRTVGPAWSASEPEEAPRSCSTQSGRPPGAM